MTSPKSKQTGFSDTDLKQLIETFNRIVQDGFMVWASKPTVISDANEILNSIPALLARLEAAELKECNQYHCGHHGCNAWRRAAGK